MRMPFKKENPSTYLDAIPAQLAEVLYARRPRSLALWLSTTSSASCTAQVAALSPDEVLSLVDIFTPDVAHTLMERLDFRAAAHVISCVPPDTGAGLVELLSDDEASRVIRWLEDDISHAVLTAMPRARSALLRGLLSWPPDTAAARMKPSFISVCENASIADALVTVKDAPEDVDEGIFVTRGKGGELRGWIPATELLVHDPSTPVTDVMVAGEEVARWSTVALAAQEKVVSQAEISPTGIVPIIDGGMILGVVTRDAVREILRVEQEEDDALQGGSSPLKMPYLQAGALTLWKARVPWLAALFIAEMYTGTVLRHFESELDALVSLAFFIPLLIGTGGNLGTQITTTIIRALTQEGIGIRNLGTLLLKELRTGTLLGVSMAVLGAIRAWTLGVPLPVLITVTLTLICICLWSSTIAAVLPLLLRAIGVDPAVVSAPLISTVVDGTGLIIYFLIARFVMIYG